MTVTGKKIFRIVLFFFLLASLGSVCLLRYPYRYKASPASAPEETDPVSVLETQLSMDNYEHSDITPDNTLPDSQIDDTYQIRIPKDIISDDEEPVPEDIPQQTSSVAVTSSSSRVSSSSDPLPFISKPSPSAPLVTPSPKPYINWTPVAVPLPQETPAVTDINSSDEPYQQGNNYENTDWWDGDWYGFWIRFNCTGSYYDLENSWLDCCASLTLNSSSDGTMILWDEETSYDSPLGYADIRIDSTDTGVTTLNSVNGLFNGISIEDPGAWHSDPSRCPYDNMLPVSGQHTDSNGSYDYLVILRPWGTKWTDIRSEDIADYSTYYYDDWYLPLIESGTASAPTVSVGSR